MQIDFTDLKATFDELASDVKDSMELDTDCCSKAFIKRTYTRAFFAMVEGSIAQLKQLALQTNRQSQVFEVFELELLEERAGSLDCNGNPKRGNAKLSLLPNVQFSMISVARAAELVFQLDKGGRGWNAMKASVKIRDRITHPKNTESLVISDDDMKTLGYANAWFRNEMLRLVALLRDSHDVVRKQPS